MDCSGNVFPTSFGASNTREVGRWDPSSAMSSIRGRAPFDFGRFDRCNGAVSRKCKSLQRVQEFRLVLKISLDNVTKIRYKGRIIQTCALATVSVPPR